MQSDPVFHPYPSHIPSSTTKKTFKVETWGLKVTLLSAAAYVSPFFISFPLAPFIQVIGLSILTFTSIGLLDSQLAYQQCKEFFKLKYISLQHQFRKIHPALIAATDALQQTWQGGLVAGVLFGIAAQATQLVALNALALTPFAVLFAIGTVTFIQIKSKKTENDHNQPNEQKKLEQAGSWSQVKLNQRPAYVAVDARKTWREFLFVCSTVVITISCIALRILLTIGTCLL